MGWETLYVWWEGVTSHRARRKFARCVLPGWPGALSPIDFTISTLQTQNVSLFDIKTFQFSRPDATPHQHAWFILTKEMKAIQMAMHFPSCSLLFIHIFLPLPQSSFRKCTHSMLRLSWCTCSNFPSNFLFTSTKPRRWKWMIEMRLEVQGCWPYLFIWHVLTRTVDRGNVMFCPCKHTFQFCPPFLLKKWANPDFTTRAKT